MSTITTTSTRTLKEIRALIRIEQDKIRARRLRNAGAAAAALAWVNAMPQGERRRRLLSPKGRHRGEPLAHLVLYRIRLESWFFGLLADALVGTVSACKHSFFTPLPAPPHPPR